MKIKKYLPQPTRPCRLLVLLLSTVYAASGQTFPTLLKTEVISGLDQPMQLVHAGDGTKRIFIVEKKGTIKVYDKDYNFLKLFHTETSLSLASEEGLLGMAFHPDFGNNGLFYTHYTNGDGNLEISRYKVKQTDPNEADPASKSLVIQIDHINQTNHNGGEMHFGSDGHLYVSTGDGGGGGDTPNNAQNTNVLLGKILRLGVSPSAEGYFTPSENPYGNLVYATGLRNPFRWSFDRLTGDMWVTDVGQGSWEEITYVPSAATKGANFGWRCYEGFAPYNMADCVPGTPNPYTPPVYAYAASSVIGSHVYRGPYAAMRGFHYAADHYTGNFYVTGRANSTAPWDTDVTEAFITRVSDFGENEDGEMFAVSLNLNAVFRIYTNDQPLPVQLINFSAAPSDAGVQLRWEAASEVNFSHYQIDFSFDSKNFISAGIMTAHGESSYQFTHYLQPTGGTVYYRLKMIDLDNTFAFSKIIALDLPNTNLANLAILPNLIKNGELTISMAEGWRKLELWDALGIQVIDKELSAGSAGHHQTIPVHSLAHGIYIARLTNQEKIIYQKIVISR